MKKIVCLFVGIMLLVSVFPAYAAQSSIALPSTPITLAEYRWDDSIDTKIQINKIDYSIEKYSYSDEIKIVLSMSGKKVYDYNGDNSSRTTTIMFKLYDAEGYVVDDGVKFTPYLSNGESFKIEYTFYSLKPGAYSLKFLNVTSSPAPTATPIPTPAPTAAPTQAPSSPPEYHLENLAYNGKAVTGKLIHTQGTGVVSNLRVRVTFYIVGNYYMSTSGVVENDGTFEVEGVGPIEYITALAYGKGQDNASRLDVGEILID